MSFSWHDAPLVRLVIPILLGCATGTALPEYVERPFWISLPVFAIIAIFFLRRKAWKHPSQSTSLGVLIFSAFVFVGVYLTLSESNNAKYQTQISHSADYHQATIARNVEPGTNSIKTELFIDSYAIGDRIVFYEKSRMAICYAPVESRLKDLKIGDRIIFSDQVQMPDDPINPGQFNYAEYLRQNGYSGSVYLGSGFTHIGSSFTSNAVVLFLRTLQHRASELFEKYGMHSRELGIASALVLGNKVLLERELKSQYADAGVVHILAVSGLHVGIIYLFLSFALSVLFGQRYPVLKLSLILILLWVYAGVTGLSPSVMRAATMFSFVALGGLSKRKANTYNMLAASAILLIVINPSIVFQVGFQLSYLAVVGIVFIYRRIYPLLVFQSKITDKVWSLLVVSLGAQLATFSLSLYYFHQFPLVFLVTNLIVIPLATVALYSGLLFLIFHWLPGLDWIFYQVFNVVLWCMNSFIELISRVPYAVVRNIEFSFAEMMLTYIFIIAAIAAFTVPGKFSIRVSLISLLTVVLISSYRTIDNTTKWQLVILEGRSAPIVCVQKCRSLVVVSSEESANKFREANTFYMEGFIRESGISKIHYMHFSENFHDHFIDVDNGLLTIPFTAIRLPTSMTDDTSRLGCIANVVIAHRNISLEFLRTCTNNSVAILGRDLPEWKRLEIMRILQKRGVRYWDMKTEGIYTQNVL